MGNPLCSPVPSLWADTQSLFSCKPFNLDVPSIEPQRRPEQPPQLAGPEMATTSCPELPVPYLAFCHCPQTQTQVSTVHIVGLEPPEVQAGGKGLPFSLAAQDGGKEA